MAQLLLVDGSSYLYRAFHALPDLRTRDGFPTGAMKGVLAMLRRLNDDFKATYKAVVFDAKGKTFRSDWYPEYKAQRPPMPEDLARQIAPIHEAIRAQGWPLLMVEGVEADDVIGTLARQATAAGMETLISTGDKDMAQLVNAHVRLVNTMSNELLDVEGVTAKFGVEPARMVDYLTLVGDTVDNVPGVAKCGAKTAVKWLTEYGSLDAIVAHANDIKGVVGQNLRDHLDFLPLGKKLVTIHCEVADLPAPKTLTPQAPDVEALQTLYARYEFVGWLRQATGEAGEEEEASSAKPPNAYRNFAVAPAHTATESEPELITDGRHRTAYEKVTDAAALARWIARVTAAPLTAVDTETTSLDPLTARIVGISLAVAAGEACYIPLAHQGVEAGEQLPIEATLARLQPWLESEQHLKVGQNIKYDQHVFANHDIHLAGIAHDTLLQSYVLESERGHDMDQLARRHLGLLTIPYTDLCGKGAKQIGFEQVAVDKAAEYAAEDADITLRLHQHLLPQVEADAGFMRIYADIELPAREVLFKMERIGVLIDVGLLRAQSHTLGQQIMALEQEAYALAGQPFNLGSPKQLAEILFVKQGLPVRKKTPGGTPSTDENVLSELALDYPLPKLLLEHRGLAKLKNTYTDKLPRMVNAATGRVHTHFSQATAITGRLASSDPNLQNIPVRTEEGRRIRAAFIAPPGSQIVSADYSQVELRIMAHLSEDARLLEAFAGGEDVHRATAAEIFGITPLEVSNDQRRVAKTINFGLIYGMSAFGLARNLGLERSAAQHYIERYFTRYPGVARYMERTRAEAHANGFVSTLFGRRLTLPEIRSDKAARRQAAERAAINAPMQGTAADLIKLAMIAVQNYLEAEKLQSRLVLQVHDELVLEVPDTEIARIRADLPRLMSGVGELKVPLLVEVGQGKDWEAAH
ncbi:DNA polymerase I [Betaproteobacteria bacterium]|nr:DNA polymerase I [Betaproteobacteria bacterium]GHU41673.1 DNA polymerase I [Betaproteobacteria bacterium]